MIIPEITNQDLQKLLTDAITLINNSENEKGRIKTNSLIKSYRKLRIARKELIRREATYFGAGKTLRRASVIARRALQPLPE